MPEVPPPPWVPLLRADDRKRTEDLTGGSQALRKCPSTWTPNDTVITVLSD